MTESVCVCEEQGEETLIWSDLGHRVVFPSLIMKTFTWFMLTVFITHTHQVQHKSQFCCDEDKKHELKGVKEMKTTDNCASTEHMSEYRPFSFILNHFGFVFKGSVTINQLSTQTKSQDSDQFPQSTTQTVIITPLILYWYWSVASLSLCQTRSCCTN